MFPRHGCPRRLQDAGALKVSIRNLEGLHPVIEALKGKLGEGLVAIVLFGSRARGEGGWRSDWDLFLIAEGLPENPFDRQLALRALVPKDSKGVSVLAMSREEFEAGFPPIYLDLAVDGIVLYDSEGFMAGKLEEIREIVKRAGLKRTRRQDTLLWKWLRRPQGRWRIDWSGVHGLKGRSAV